MLPNVNINFKNGSLGGVAMLDDSVCGLITTASAVSTFELGKAYEINSLAELESYGVNHSNNANLHDQVRQFYSETPAGTTLWVMAVASTVSMADMADKDGSYFMPLINAAQGKIRQIAISKPIDADDEQDQGLSDDVFACIAKAQISANEATNTLKAPLFVLVSASGFNDDFSVLPDLNTYSDNRVGVVFGDVVANSKTAAVGLALGRVAFSNVHESMAKVSNGAISEPRCYIGADPAELHAQSVEAKGYICPRSFVGLAGYYWANDKLATKDADDYAYIPRRRTIDKAYRITYTTLLNYVGQEIAVDSNGRPSSAYLKSIEGAVEDALVNSMRDNLGADPADANDKGVKCSIPQDQNIVATNLLNVNLAVKPYGYSKYIEVSLALSTNI